MVAGSIVRPVTSLVTRPVASQLLRGGIFDAALLAKLKQALLVSRTIDADGTIRDETPGLGTFRMQQPGRAYQPNGTGYVNCGNVANITSDQLSISCWFRIATNPITSRRYLIAKAPNTVATGYGLDVELNGTVRVLLGTGTLFAFTTVATVPLGQWNHIAAVYNGVTIKVYLNGTEIYSAAMSGNIQGNTDNLTVGGFSSGTAVLDGRICDVRVCSSALTPTEVSELYTLKTAALPNKPTLVHYKCDDQHPTIAYDSSGNARHGIKTSINAAVGQFHYEGNDVPFSWQNEVGYSAGLVPRNESVKTFDVLGNTLTYTGKSGIHAKVKQSNCGTFDGVDDYVAISGLSGGVTVVSSGGTSAPTVSAGRIDFTAGTCWDLVLSNGSIYPFSEGDGTVIHDVSGNGNHGTATSISEASFWGTKQDVFHRNVLEGFSLRENGFPNSEPTSGGVGLLGGAADSEFVNKLGVSGMLTCPSGNTLVYHYQGWAPQTTTIYAECVIKMDDSSQPVYGLNTGHGDFSFISGGAFLGGTPTYTDLGDGFWRIKVTGTVSVSTNSNSGVIRYAGQSGKGFRVSRVQFGNNVVPGYTKTVGTGITYAKYPAKSTTTDVLNLPLTHPPGSHHNAAESQIDLTGGVAFPGASGMTANWAFNAAQTNPEFHRTTRLSSVDYRADRFIVGTEVLSGDALSSAQAFVTQVDL